MRAPLLRGETVALRGVTVADAAFLSAGFSHPEIERFYGPQPDPPVNQAERVQVDVLSPRRVVWVIEVNGSPVGYIQLTDVTLGDSAQIALWLKPEGQQHRGLGTDAAKAVLAWAFGEPLHLQRVDAQIAEDNVKSQGLFTKLAFEPEPDMSHLVWATTQNRPVRMWHMTKTKWDLHE